MSASPLEKFLARVRHKPTGTEGHYIGHCPTARHSHGDRNPSLSFSIGSDGKLLLKCHSQNCTPKEIMTAVRLTERDLFPDKGQNGNGGTRKRSPRIYPSWVAALDALEFGLLKRQEIIGPRIATYEYVDVVGQLVGVVARFPTATGKTFRPVSVIKGGWIIRDPPGLWPLYRLNELKQSKPVAIVEGEKCAIAAAEIGLNATTHQGGANKVACTDWTSLRDREAWIFRDKDEPGEICGEAISSKLVALGCRVKFVDLPGLSEGEDIVEFIAARREDSKEDSAILHEILDLAQQTNYYEPSATGNSNDGATPEPAVKTGFKWNAISSPVFRLSAERPEWIIKRMLVKHQPAIAGGPRKALKTSVFIDMVISIGTGTRFLGYFEVPRSMRTAILSGESGQWTLYETANRICQAREIDFDSMNVDWGFDLPQLSNLEDLQEMREGLTKNGIEVLVIDPAYLCLLDANATGEASNLFKIGPLLLNIAKACRDVGATPILLHHARKNLASAFDPLELEDLSHAGFQEFARQWVLISRREKYSLGTGQHKLWISAGGSVGFSSLHAIDIDEGQLDDDFGGRKWDVQVKTFDESIMDNQRQAAQVKRDAEQQEEKKEDAAVLSSIDFLDPNGQGAGKERAFGFAKLSRPKFNRCVTRLVAHKIIEEVPVTAEVGKGAKRIVQGLRRKRTPDGLFDVKETQ